MEGWDADINSGLFREMWEDDAVGEESPKISSLADEKGIRMRVIEPPKVAEVKKKEYVIDCFCGAQLEIPRGSLKRSLKHKSGELVVVYHAICPECENIHDVPAWWRRTEGALEAIADGVPVKVIHPSETLPRARAKNFVCKHCQKGLEGVSPREVGRTLERYQDEPSEWVYYFICIACDERNTVIPWW